MAQKRFGTRKAALICLQTHQADEPFEPPQLKFGTSRRVKLVLQHSPGGAAPCLSTGSAAVFCSVSTVSPTAVLSLGSPARKQGKGTVVDPGVVVRQQNQRDEQAPSSLERLPVAIKKGDELLPYVWDGQRITAMDEAALQDSDLNKGRLRNWFLGIQRRLHEAFLPDPRDVTPDYWEWLRWRLSQRFFSSTMQNFSFSALLMATGLGAKKAFAASAAINWLLKDGVSRIVRMAVSTSFGQTFDADLKRMRFVTSLIFTACMAGEFATPFWPQHFVALASVSSVGRAIGLSAFVATQPAFQAALATGGNLADLTSKNQAQHMVMDMLALGVSAGLTWLCRGKPRGGLLLPAVMYPICAAGDLTCIWHELKAVQLRTLNRERAEMVIERWIKRGTVPDAAEISAAESLILPTDVWRGVMPLRITPLDRLAAGDPHRLRQLLQEYDGEQYVLHVAGRTTEAAGAGPGASGRPRTCDGAEGRSSGDGGGGGGGEGGRRWLPSFGLGGGGGGGGKQPEVLVSLSDQATPQDITKAILHAAYLRKAVLQYIWEHLVDPAGDRDPHPHHHKQLHHHHHHGHGQPHNNHQSHNHKQQDNQGQSHSHSLPPANQQQPLEQGGDGSVFVNWDSGADGGGNATIMFADTGDVGGDGDGDGGRTDQGAGSSHHSGRHQHPEHHKQQPEDWRVYSHGLGYKHSHGRGHTHDHMHWDAQHYALYHHSHYHTHTHGPGHSHSHGHGHGGVALPAHTASLSLSQGGGGSNNSHHHRSGSGGSAGGCGYGSEGVAGGSSYNINSSNGAGPLPPPHASVVDGGTTGPFAVRRLDDGEPVGAGGISWCACCAPPCCAPMRGHDGADDHDNGHRSRSKAPSPKPRSAAPVTQWDRLDEATWAALVRSSRREAARNLPQLVEQAEQAGWKLKPFMLNTTERVQFVRL